MTIVRNLVTMALMLGVFALALVFAQSDDYRNRLLAYITIIVYISIGVYHVARIARR